MVDNQDTREVTLMGPSPTESDSSSSSSDSSEVTQRPRRRSPPHAATSQWTGDVQGIAWNTNGLVTADHRARREKITVLIKLMRDENIDFVVITRSDNHGGL